MTMHIYTSISQYCMKNICTYEVLQEKVNKEAQVS